MNINEYLLSLKGKTVSVIGIGISNQPLIELLLKNNISVTARDRAGREALGDIAARFEALGAKLILGDNYLDNLNEAVIFRTPGLKPSTPELVKAIENGAVVTSEMEVFFEVCPCPIIAVTGSDGKTTTTTIVSKILETAGKTVHLGGNIGRPLLADADKISPNDWAVLELSSFQLMTMKQSPKIAIITNITPNHLDYHSSMEEYTEAKCNVFKYQKPGDLLVLNADYQSTAVLAGEAKGSLRMFSSKAKPMDGCYYDGKTVYFNDEPVIDGSEILLPGLHNIENYMAAFAAVCDIAGKEACRLVAETFGGVEHRVELVRVHKGVRYYNDSIASSPTRSTAGLKTFGKKVILIAGGYDKHIPYDDFGPIVNQTVKVLVLTGQTAPLIKEAVLKAEGEKPKIIEEEDFKTAVLKAAAEASDGDVVILSPASASFGRFKNFEERGNYFKNIVMNIN
jgi:UDP-N-acetylmuramoylalanine--D-glutamate ligase